MTIAAKLKKLQQANYRETEPLTLPDGTLVILSSLTGTDDIAISEYIQEHLDGAFAPRSKVETLAHSIKWVQTPDGDQVDLRGLTHIVTGDRLDNGTAVKKTKHAFMRELIVTWPDQVLDALFARYAKMMKDVDESLTRGIKVELGDAGLKAKIDSVLDELEVLVREAKRRGVEVDPSLASYFHIDQTPEEKQDALEAAMRARALHQQAASSTQEEVHPVDEQLAQEMDENPKVYRGAPVPEPEVEQPQRIRR